MRIIVGLGNPGKDHERTRHNIGFRAIDAFRERHADIFDNWKKKFDGHISVGKIDDEKVLLLKPQTYMNRSGISVQMAASFWKVEPKDLVIIYDDFMLPLGILRLRAGGSSGGHNGMRSIMQSIGTQNFPRLRIGIGHERMTDVPKDAYVLERFSDKEELVLTPVIAKTADTLDSIITEGIDIAMNACNGKQDENEE